MATVEKVTEKTSSRAILLRAAADLMIERGTIEVSLNEIAQRSQLNSALVKYYFGSKNGLMLALVEDVLGPGLEQLKGLVEMDLPVVEKLKLHIKGIINVYFRYPFVNRLIHAMLMEQELAIKVSEKISKPLAETQRQLLQQGMDSGQFKHIDPMMFYFIVLGACDQLFFGQHVLNHAFGIERIDEDLKRAYTNALLDMVLGGILTEEGQRA
ncbi:transcriptional regulator [Sphingobium jiangsuense]|uniref:AcrR family transcriptional regulator n=1 Tax=Sphingobium jiangsuense TaxID=870476 RepID=A0A7W6FQ82_9SPHN|nr:TetR family transcriptional regulator [Sphingobium jiangsuense]MBB3925769.1 AcrR family transcriptional regulator [Sphingobium jiangsuense]GLT02592.1 transcriptional regulator [Sphingobium jiangsuense]